MSCENWGGLPSAPPYQMSCGVFWFLHIGKTGGTSVTDHLRKMSREHGYLFKELFDYKRVFSYEARGISSSTIADPPLCLAWRDGLSASSQRPFGALS